MGSILDDYILLTKPTYDYDLINQSAVLRDLIDTFVSNIVPYFDEYVFEDVFDRILGSADLIDVAVQRRIDELVEEGMCFYVTDKETGEKTLMYNRHYKE